MTVFSNRFICYLLVCLACFSTTIGQSFGQVASGPSTGTGGSTNWDPSTLEVLQSQGVSLYATCDGDGNVHVVPLLTDNTQIAGDFSCFMTTSDGSQSIMIDGTVWLDGSVDMTSTTASAANNGSHFANASGNASSWRGFWGDYWYYLTHPSAMDDDLETGFYVAVGTSAVAGAAAGGLVVAGVNPVIWGGTGAAVGGGAAAGGTAAAELGIGTQAVVAPGLGAGSYPGLLINGTVYVARFHEIAWQMAGRAEPIAKYGIAIVDATGKVIGWL